MDGGSLEELLARRGALPEGVLARVAADVLEGLAWLHGAKHMIHRDIKVRYETQWLASPKGRKDPPPALACPGTHLAVA